MDDLSMDPEHIALLAQQELFFQSQQEPCVTLGKITDNSVTRKEEKAKKMSLFRRQRIAAKKTADPANVTVSNFIVEKDTSGAVFAPPSSDNSQQEAFPAAIHRSCAPKSFSTSRSVSTSIFKPDKRPTDPTKPFTVQISEHLRVEYSKLEEDKLKWQDSIHPDSKTIHKDKVIIDGVDKWRFDFQGKLLDGENEDTRKKSELFHHGKEPDLPGYTVEEMFKLSRSSFPQQRTIAMTTLAAALRKVKEGDDPIPLIETILEADGMVYIRSALDDTQLTSLGAAISCIHALIVPFGSVGNAYITEQHMCWFGKNQLLPLSPLLVDQAENENEVQLSKRDLILAFVLKMKGIERLRYIGESFDVSEPCVIQILQIIERCCLHSEELSSLLFNCEFLVPWLLENLAQMENPNKISRSILSIRILWIIARANKEAAKQISANKKVILFFDILFPLENIISASEEKQIIMAYMVDLRYVQCLHGFHGNEPAVRLDKEMAVPQICGLMALLHEYFFPSMMEERDNSIRFLTSMNTCIQYGLVLVTSGTAFQRTVANTFPIGAWVIWIFEAILWIQKTQYNDVLRIDVQTIWEGVRGNLLALLLELKKKAIRFDIHAPLDILSHKESICSSMNMVQSELECSEMDQVNFSPFLWNKSIVDLFLCNENICLKKATRRYAAMYWLMLLEVLFTEKSSRNHVLQFLGSKCVYSSIENVFNACKMRLEGEEVLLLDNKKRNLFLFQFRSVCWLAQYAFSCMIHINKDTLSPTLDTKRMYQYALESCRLVPHGCEAFLSRTLRAWVFNKQLLVNFIENLPYNNGETTEEIVGNIMKLHGAFSHTLLPPSLLAFSESLYDNQSIDSFFLVAHKSMLPLQQNWWLLPIKLWYEETLAPSEDNIVAKGPNTTMLLSVLIFICTIVTTCDEVLKAKDRGNIFAEISKCFLFPGEVFLSPSIGYWLVSLRDLVAPSDKQIVFEDRLFTYAKEFVAEYSASSYGNSLFTSFVLYFLQMQHPSDFRKLVWDELRPLLGLLVPSGENFDDSCFLTPVENDPDMIQSIMFSITSTSSAWQKKNPFLLRVAVHHLASAFFGVQDQVSVLSPWKKKQLWNQLPSFIQEIISTHKIEEGPEEGKEEEKHRRSEMINFWLE